MLNSKFKAHFYRLSSLLLLLPLSFSALAIHSHAAEAEDNKQTKESIKVELYANDEALDFEMNKVNYLNFTATIGLVSPEAKFTTEDNFQVPQSDLVQLVLPKSASTHSFQTALDLQSNEFRFVAKRPTAWLLNLQLKGYNLVKSAFDSSRQVLRLDFRKLTKDVDSQLNYFTGELNSIQSKGKQDLTTVRKNLNGVLQAANLETAQSPIYNLLNGQLLTDLSDKCYLLGLASDKENLHPALQTLSYTLIYQGEAMKDELYNLPLVQTSQANVYDKNSDVRHYSARDNAKDEISSTDKVASATTAKLDSQKDSKLTAEQSKGLSKDQGKLPANEQAKVKKSSKYQTKIISPNDTTIVPSTGETAASIGISMLCFISATAIYAIKRHFN